MTSSPLRSVLASRRALICLVIDDDAFVRMATSRALQRLHVGTVLEAANGAEAMEILRASGRDVDLIVCDLEMPRVDGIQTMEFLAKLKTSAGIVIQSSRQEQALHAASEFAQANSLNVMGALAKPVSGNALEGIIVRILEASTETAVKVRPIVDISVAELQTAIRERQFIAHYQPKVTVSDGRPTGMEALVRWNHPDLGLVGPDSFIPVAEREGLIDDVTKQVIAMALREAASLIHDGLINSVSINLSTASLKDRTFTEYIINAIRRWSLRPENVVLEITESAMIEDLQSALHILTRLHLNGIKLSIDDFGTGFSSMHQLLRFPFGELKIDRMFVFEAHDNPVQRAILEATIGLADRLNLVTVAEGAETEQDWKLLTELRPTEVQGYFIQRPAPIDRVRAWIESAS
ncbi:MAG: EAL domain-containing response regulator [Alphaproteobacteria bacterium]